MTLYKNIKIKTSRPLPTEEDSSILEVNCWIHFDEKSLQDISPLELGWKYYEYERILIPVWFTGNILLLVSYV